MPAWTADQVLRLAPDPAAAKAGQSQADPRKWPAVGHDDAAAWGECQGSGTKPYQVQVDLAGPAFKCSCPSRKFPCKHGLGLMLLLAAGKIAPAGRPAWVEQWLASRAASSEKKAAAAAAPPKPDDPAAAAKRRDQREARVADGLATLGRWIDDLARNGIATVPTAGPDFFDAPARRLIDAQAPGVARRLRDLADATSSGANWQQRFAEQLARLHLLVRAFERRDTLPPDTRDDVLAEIGLPVSAEDLAARPKIADAWQVLAQETAVEDKLRVQRTWLFGTATRRPALVLAFAHGRAPLDSGLVAGTRFDGELTFYPGHAVRAAVATKGPPTALTEMLGLATLDALADAESLARAAHPWLGPVAWPVHAVTPVRTDDGFLLADAAGHARRAKLSTDAGWTLLAVSGGRPVDLVAETAGDALRPLAVVAAGAYVALTRGEADDTADPNTPSGAAA